MKPQQITINQHYVPQTYLRRFQAGDKLIWSFDREKHSAGRRARAIKSVCSSDHYYDLPATLDRTSVEFFQRVEKDLQRVEDIGTRFLQSSVNGLSKILGQPIDPRQWQRPPIRLYKNLTDYVALQFLRTEAARKIVRIGLHDMTRQHMQEIADEIAPGVDVSSWNFRVRENWIKYYHILTIYNFRDYGDYFYKKIWRFGINSTEHVLWTSDNPVAVLSQKPDSTRPDLEEHGVRIAFPLSPQLVLIMYEDKYYQRMASLDGKPISLSVDDVSELNELQFNQACRYVLSSSPFDAACIDAMANKRKERMDASQLERDWWSLLNTIGTAGDQSSH